MNEPQRIGKTLHESKPQKENIETSKPLKVDAFPAPEFLPEKPRDIESIPPKLRRAIRACTDGAAQWPMFVFGPAGTGKSCAALCLADRVRMARFWSEEELNQAIIDAMMGRLVNTFGYETTPNDLWSIVKRAPLVIIDEVGSRMLVSDHRYAVLKNVLDLREQKPLVLISNLPPDKIAAHYDDRIASRALCGTVVDANGEDRRLSK